MEFVIIGVIIIFILNYNRVVDTNRFVTDTEPYFRALMEDDYIFLLGIRYPGRDVNINELYGLRVRNGLLTIVALIFVFFNQLSFLYILIAVIAGYFVFKSPYNSLKSYYKANLHHINLMLPYYLKSLEILVQHYTVPIALSRSIETSPEVFRTGLKRLVARIDSGDSSIQPYIDFANEYPVRDSMRMMRLLYRLGLGSQQDKHEQVMMFSRTVSALQNKAREQKYKERLEHMENQTMVMLMTTGGGVMGLMLLSMMMLMNF
jgi:hypothetical protein